MTNRKRVATIRLKDEVLHFELYPSPAAFACSKSGEPVAEGEEFIDLSVVNSDSRVVHRKFCVKCGKQEMERLKATEKARN
jgi:hypothetical protein